MCTQTHHTYLKQALAAEHSGIFSWVGTQKNGNPIKLNGAFFTLYAILCLSSLLLLKPNLEPYF
jgi:hypothetical protein